MFVGVLLTFIIEVIINRQNIIEEDELEINHFDRFFFMIIWPYLLYKIIEK
jgi:hypothetical protein